MARKNLNKALDFNRLSQSLVDLNDTRQVTEEDVFLVLDLNEQQAPIQVVLSLKAIMKCMGPQSLNEMVAGVIEKAGECTQCGECETRCPYELPIPELLKSTVARAEKEIEK